MRSELVRKEIPMYTDSIFRPSSKPPDKQNSLEGDISKKISHYINQIYRPPPKPPNTQNTKGEKKWIFRKKPYMKSFCRPPPKPNINIKTNQITRKSEVNQPVDPL